MKEWLAEGWLLLKFRFNLHVREEKALAYVAERLPRRLREAVLADCAVRATHPSLIGRDTYAGPDGVDYKRMYDAINFERRPQCQIPHHDEEAV